MSVPHSLHAPLNADKLLRRQLHLEYYNVSYSGEESKHFRTIMGEAARYLGNTKLAQ